MILGTIHSAHLDWPWRILLQDHKSFLVNANPYTLYSICNSERILVVPWELLHHTPHILYSYEHPKSWSNLCGKKMVMCYFYSLRSFPTKKAVITRKLANVKKSAIISIIHVGEPYSSSLSSLIIFYRQKGLMKIADPFSNLWLM